MGDVSRIYGQPFKSVLIRHQVGRGVISDWFRGIFGYVQPYLTRGLRATANEALTTGSKILGEIATAQRDQNTNNKTGDIIKRNIRAGTGRLAEMAASSMSGSGVRRRRKPARKSSRKKNTSMKGYGQGRKTSKKKSNASIKGVKKGNVSQSGGRRGTVKKGRVARRTLKFEPDIFG